MSTWASHYVQTLISEKQVQGKDTVHTPLGEEAENMVLALLRQPRLSGDEELDLVDIDLEDLRRERRDKVLRERAIRILQRARELRRVPKPVEQPPQRRIRPLLRLPPLAALPLVLVLRHRVLGDLQVHELEEQAAPRHEALRALLVRAEVHHEARLVRLEDEVQHRRDLRRRGGRRGGHVRRDAHERGEQLADDLGHHVVLLAEAERAHDLERGDAARGDLADLVAREQRLDGVEEAGPVVGEVVRDERLERRGELPRDAARRGRREEAEDARLEGVAVGLRDGGLPRARGVRDEVGCGDAVFEVDGARLAGRAAGPVVQFWVHMHMRRGEGRARTHISTLSAAIICSSAVTIPSCPPICGETIRAASGFDDGGACAPCGSGALRLCAHWDRDCTSSRTDWTASGDPSCCRKVSFQLSVLSELILWVRQAYR